MELFRAVTEGTALLSNDQDADIFASWKVGGQDFYAYATINDANVDLEANQERLESNLSGDIGRVRKQMEAVGKRMESAIFVESVNEYGTALLEAAEKIKEVEEGLVEEYVKPTKCICGRKLTSSGWCHRCSKFTR